MKDRGLVMFVSVISIVLIAIIALIVIISNITGDNRVVLSYPVSSPNTIRIVPKDLEKYNYVGIDKDYVVSLMDLTGKTKIITLENKEWRDIKWSPDNTLVSILGKVNDVYNLFIFDLSQERLEQITFYNELGVDNYEWINDDELIYIQGEGSDRWLHSYKYSTKSQLLKINRVDGDLIKTDNSNSIYTFKTSSSFDLRDKTGKLIIKLSNSFINDDLEINLKDLIVLDTLDDLILLDTDYNVYLYNIISNDLKKLEINFFSDLTLACSLSDTTFNLYTKNINSLEILSYDLTTDLMLQGDIVVRDFETIENDSIKHCRDGKYLLSAKIDETTKWYVDDSFKEILILEDYLNIDYKY